MSKDKQQQKNKKPYEKPKLRRMSLRADEVLAVGCKTALNGGGSGLLGGNCIAGGCIDSIGS